MAADIFDELERIVPLEQRDEFLRLARELRDYGGDNPELRIVEGLNDRARHSLRCAE